MKLSTSLTLLLLSTSFSAASSLAVYQDQALYQYSTQMNYVGFSKGIHAKCDGNTVALHKILSCPPQERLCQELASVREIQKGINVIQYNGEALDKLSSLAQPTQIDAASWIASAKLLGEEKARLLSAEQKAKKDLKVKSAAFQKQVTSPIALATKSNCTGTLSVTIPYGKLTFSTAYEANIISKNEVKVTQTLSMVNRSGIDIVAQTGFFYYRAGKSYVRAIHFNPWIVRKYAPRVRKMLKKSRAREMLASDEPTMEVSMASPVPVPRVQVSYIDAREYKIANLNLPSTGVPLEVEMLSWSAPLICEIKAYPYVNSKAFEVCSFNPKQQIDSNQWKIKEGAVTLNEKARGEYRDGKYQLYTKNEDDIQIIRKSIVKKSVKQVSLVGLLVKKMDLF